MENSILVIERIVLEALDGKSLNLKELKKHTGFTEALLKAILHNMIERGLILKRKELFEINWECKERWLPVVTNKEGMKAEVMELFSSLLSEIYKKSENANLKIQKIWLDKDEIERLKYKFEDIERFIQGVKEKRKVQPVKEFTCERQVVFFGRGCYEDLMNNIIRAS